MKAPVGIDVKRIQPGAAGVQGIGLRQAAGSLQKIRDLAGPFRIRELFLDGLFR